MNDETPGYTAHFQRGALLRSQRRFKEAGEFLGQAIAADPERAGAYAELALCLNDQGNQAAKAIQAIDRAIGLEPTNAHFLGLKGWILVCQFTYHEALRVANRAVETDPNNITALNAQANAYTKLGFWKKAENSTRRILALDVNDAPALNLLAQALRYQGRGKESQEAVDRLLSLLPDNAFGHMNAGYGALEAGDHVRANEHFLISLKMDPHCKLAQLGLLHSLRGRAWIYRVQFRLFSFLRQPASNLRVLGIAALVVGVILAMMMLEAIYPGLGGWTISVGLSYLFLSFFSRQAGDLFLMFEPMGRRALTLQDKVNACLFAFVIALFLGGAAMSQEWSVFLGILLYLGIFAFSILYPPIKDRWRRWKESRNPA
jgi:Tfp pilus assembly protein PilF